ncbi:hypothetical protein HNR05_002605 [Leifsonia psychrotolerans]|uniref:Terminase n=1 Tax=Glaciibacter psychrotolerans TaxID=670054 RepID=A0A7Z0EFR5_9MICO|nr:hypothetical protein [Leifsonia psychrotolerans]
MWETTRDRGIRPDFAGRYSDDPELRREFLAGARLYGMELVDLDDADELARLKAMTPRRWPLQPQQLRIADTLNAKYDSYVIEIPRRASKTTTIFMWLLGRMKSRPGYQATFSAQNGVAGSRRLREWGGTLDRVNPAEDLDLPPWMRGRPKQQTKAHKRAVALFGEDLLPPADDEPTGRGFRIMRGEVGKGIYFDNGSQLLVLKPEADAYRGEAADVSWIDEAQEIDPVAGEDLLAGIVPLQDTKEDSAIVISGTAGEARVGVLWEYLEKLREGSPYVGGLDYCAPEDTPWEVIEDEERAMALIAQHHPGIGTLTTMEKMRKNWHELALPKWAREYLSLWPETFGTRAIDPALWAEATAGRHVPIPARVAFGMAIKPGGGTAAIAAAWRNQRGKAYIEIIEHRSGTDWIPKRAQELTKKYRGSTIAYDDIGEGKATATEMQMLTPKPRMRVQTYREIAAGCVQVLRELGRHNLVHFDDAGLNSAVDNAAKREVRGDQGVWLWTPKRSGEDNVLPDITCLDAGTRALRNWDQYFAVKSGSSKPIMAD